EQGAHPRLGGARFRRPPFERHLHRLTVHRRAPVHAGRTPQVSRSATAML
ncbi:MAG: hypothetical protein AVDCRST_MAG04-1671, partial [uncultured Acetobacteraceae bacterium]